MRKRFATFLTVLSLALLTVSRIHAADEPKPAEPPPETTTDASKGGFTIKSGDNVVTFGGFGQFRATVDDREDFDADPVGSLGAGTEDGPFTSFDIPRVRLWVRGTMFKPWIRYRLNWELSRTAGELDSKLKDAWVEFGAKPILAARIGQYKVPFSLQELTGDEYQIFTERAIDNVFSPARDMGVTVGGTTTSKRLGYAVGVFNGSGEDKRQDDQNVMYAARLWVDPLGEYKLIEGTTENPEKNVLHLGLGYRGGEATKNPDTIGTAIIFENADDQKAFNVEFAWKWRRLFATAEYFGQTTENENPAPATADVDGAGYHGEFAVGLGPHFEIGVRYAEVDNNTDVDNDKLKETKAVGSWYIKGHNAKVQFELGQLAFEALAPGRGTRLASAAGQEVKDRSARLQVQLLF
jgi:phosphate-selective porin